MKRKIELRDGYADAYDTFTYWGLNPVKGKYPILNHIRMSVVWITGITLYISMIVATCMESKFEVIIGMLYFSISQATYLLKLTNYFIKSKKIMEVRQMLDTELFTSYEDNQHNYVVKSVYEISLLSKIFRCMIVIWLLTSLSFPIVENTLFIFPGWYPFDMQKFRWLIILYQLFTQALSALINSSIDIVTVGYMSAATTHFSIIKDTLMNIKKGEDPADVRRKIAHCCYYHNCTLDITKSIEDVFSYGILLQFIASMMTLCITGFEMLLVSEVNAEFVMLMAYLVLIMVQVSLYCWFGHDLMLKSEEVRDACYMSEWTDYDATVRKMLFIMMERSKRPVILTAGKLLFLNIPTLVNVNLLTSHNNSILTTDIAFYRFSGPPTRTLQFYGVYSTSTIKISADLLFIEYYTSKH